MCIVLRLHMTILEINFNAILLKWLKGALSLDNIFLPMERINDRVIWVFSRSGGFLCRPFKRSITSVRLVSNRWKTLWDLPILLKVICFSSLLLKDRLVVRGGLQHMGLIQKEGYVCPICGDGNEDSQNLFVHCALVEKTIQ